MAGGDAGRAGHLAEDDSQHDRDRHPFSVANSGVSVSWRAKNAGDSALTRTCAGRPSASHISVCAVAALSDAVNAPCSNSIRTIGLAEHDQAERCRQERGPTASSSAARLRARDEPADPRRAAARVSSGTSTVPMATPTMPSGSSIRRLAKYSHDTADGEDDAITAPAMTSNCGPASGDHARYRSCAKKPRICASNEMPQRPWRCVAAAAASSRIASCSSPAAPTVAAITQRGK